MALIKLNYNLAIEQANQLYQAGTICNDTAKEIEKYTNILDENWDGEASEEMRNKLGHLIMQLLQTKDKLYEASSSLRTTSDNIKAIDEENARREEKNKTVSNVLENSVKKVGSLPAAMKEK